MKPPVYGAKADNLSRLQAAGFNVPKFYVIAPAGNLKDPRVAQKLRADFQGWLTKNHLTSAAIRSSSTHEDSAVSSFAGQYESVLDVRDGDGFLTAVKTVLTSQPSPAYARAGGAMHIIVQEFIEPDVSGVVFSVNPANGNPEFVINAAAGRGTNVVEGRAATQYFVNRLDLTFSTRSDVTSPAGEGVLTAGLVNQLAALTLQVESLFGTPQDIEWAIKGPTIFVLQARPITRINHLRLWDSSNIAESFPGLVLPLTFSIAKRGYQLAYKAQGYAAGLSWYELEAQHRTLDAMIAIFNGKMYYNLLNWNKFIALFPGSQRNQKFLDDQIATQGAGVYQAPARQAVGFKLQFLLRVIYRTVFFKRELADFYARFARYEGELSRLPVSQDVQLLMQHYTHTEQTIIPYFGRSVDNDFFVMTYHGWLKKLLARWLPERSFDQASIIGAIKDVVSVDQALSLYKLADAFKSDHRALTLLQKHHYQALEEHIQGTDIRAQIDQYKEKFGHRFAEDQKIEAVNPVLKPFGVFEILQPYVKLDSVHIAARLAAGESAGLDVEHDITSQLSLARRMVFRVLMGRLKQHLRIREKNRLLRGRVYGHLRELFPKIGQALAAEGVIKAGDDIFYLEIEEIYKLMQGSLITNDLPARIERRRAAYKQFPSIPMPERFVTTKLASLEDILLPRTTSPAARPGDSLPGLVSSPGTVEGRVVVLDEPVIPSEPYDILVAKHTDPGWTPLIALAKGVIVEHGGMLSHAAIVTRELSIPSIIGVKSASVVLKTGMTVRINTQLSSVEILER